MTPAGFPHSDILGSQLVCQLLEAYRRLQRPSSAPTAKASTMCSYKLDTKIKDARVHCAVLKVRAVPPTTGAYSALQSGSSRSGGPSSQSFDRPEVSFRPIPQDPTVCHVEVLAGLLTVPTPKGVLGRSATRKLPRRCSIRELSPVYV